MSITPTDNALINETSPYLRQHANNPVQWYPWGEEALNLAREQGKPILLSIGYAACHWCHVMAHESFEDTETALIMNELFINIKVDREERPDLDKIYQTAHHIMMQRGGGWPLTMFLHHETHVPFFGGTYFPPTPRHELPAFRDILLNAANYYCDNVAEIDEFSAILTNALNTHSNPKSSKLDLSSAPFNQARQELGEHFDAKFGGFSPAPKFPHLPQVQRLIHHYITTVGQRQADEDAIDMAIFSLRKMVSGGLYDHVGGGFFRYSVDEEWGIPHFEKMLYDNAAFLNSCADAWRLSQHPMFKNTALHTADWVLREMQSEEGGFYSSLDADSEGVEGKFYVWQREEIEQLLDEESYALFKFRFGLHRQANFEGDWHLTGNKDYEKVAKKFDLTDDEAIDKLNAACQQLFEVREQRVRPACDDKILTSWNALMIKALARAGRVFGEEKYTEAALKALDFIKAKLWKNGRLLAAYHSGSAHLNAYLDDYAYLLDALLEVLQTQWRHEDVAFAQQLADVLLSHFEDKDAGGFYFTSHDHEQLIARPKSFADEAMPSGNAVAAYALGRLGHIVGNTDYLDATERTLQAAIEPVKQIASAHNTLLLALEDYFFPPQYIFLRGHAEDLPLWQRYCQRGYLPLRMTFTLPEDDTGLPSALAAYTSPPAGNIAYVCGIKGCLPPVTKFEKLAKTLGA